MGKKLWRIFGPVLLAVAILLVLLFAPFNYSHFSSKDEQRAAVALNSVVFKNQQLKKQALSDQHMRYIPFFGSSEWERMDAFHPSVLAVKYQRSYRPFLLGRRGTQSLTQYFGMQTILPQLQNKQAVFVISPQWFDHVGAEPAAFDFYFSNLQGADWLCRARNTAVDRYAARRFLALQGKGRKDDLAAMYRRIAQGKALTPFQKWEIRTRKNVLEHEDELFSNFHINDNYDRRILKQSQYLPKKFSYGRLSRIAGRMAARGSSNNAFGISNRFYRSKIRPIGVRRLRGVQRRASYLRSPEYGDLQLLLTQFAQSNINVMIVIPPVNHKWAAYTGLKEARYQRAVRKIKYQLHEQSFNRVLDLSKDGDQPYFMEDTIHLGWRGWLAFDKGVYPFLTKKQKQPHYRINNRFLSKKWQQLRFTESDARKLIKK
ncbi:D-alanyl-lipoteichoic acid biosynthesis protein DltD [Oenococcus kitaharae]|uniref:D-alanyl-lipoteichoic acid biosynthesis protein DltD n=1 Tax=Oenococcus TaxID=46254 RepID=UPI0021E7A723|nr:D-alanyl-lipoteichoic acid biosynthesis protein DltD [Oenococcus kitaharae]MCV3296848.1 D-alanyl-lipoteichoic acid biosynthesis protein DltD [Oenococcus kitaharae]